MKLNWRFTRRSAFAVAITALAAGAIRAANAFANPDHVRQPSNRIGWPAEVALIKAAFSVGWLIDRGWRLVSLGSQS